MDRQYIAFISYRHKPLDIDRTIRILINSSLYSYDTRVLTDRAEQLPGTD